MENIKQISTEIIELPYGGTGAQFAAKELINYFIKQKINYLIIGATHVTLNKHPKPKSLDVWLRKHKNVTVHKDTCQAVGSIITQLIRLEQFSRGISRCSDSNRMCKALIFCEK